MTSRLTRLEKRAHPNYTTRRPRLSWVSAVYILWRRLSPHLSEGGKHTELSCCCHCSLSKQTWESGAFWRSVVILEGRASKVGERRGSDRSVGFSAQLSLLASLNLFRIQTQSVKCPQRKIHIQYGHTGHKIKPRSLRSTINTEKSLHFTDVQKVRFDTRAMFNYKWSVATNEVLVQVLFWPFKATALFTQNYIQSPNVVVAGESYATALSRLKRKRRWIIHSRIECRAFSVRS